MLHERNCPDCGARVQADVVNETPEHFAELAAARGVSVDVIVREFRHVSHAVLQLAPHDGPCGWPCVLGGGEGERVHDGTDCPCNDTISVTA